MQESLTGQMKIHYAHSLPASGIAAWELLHAHLNAVADLAFKHASVFGGGDWARLCGLWHDLGKYSDRFQDYLKSSAKLAGEDVDFTGKVDHSTAGAQHAVKALNQSCPPMARLLAYCIAGHHSGLLDSGSLANDDVRGTLANRLKKPVDTWSDAPSDLLAAPSIEPPKLQWDSHVAGFQMAMLGRMLFSCLVDSDFLCTESFMNQIKHTARQTQVPQWAAWVDRVDQYVAQKQVDAIGDSQVKSGVNRMRAAVYEQCVEAAIAQPGFFSLTVPTGGGKTLASFAFALRHAAKHQMGRVIYALPFTSIIEQNVQVLRDALGEDGGLVLEHHINLDPDKETHWGRLASENWDAPVVVTTNVQLLESLFACRTSRCRKLHRLARSVIILDEAQSLPVDLLRPCLAALAELVRNYGVTIVLCTATQPAIEIRKDFPIGLADVRPIIDQPEKLFEALRRVEVKIVGELTADQLAGRISAEPHVLCVVETKRRAAELFNLVSDRGVEAIHLSAALCPAHRSPLIELIKVKLRAGEPCRVISTQLIEAGVDVDFPVVYRSIAGLDAIAQAAGRCNREGRLPGLGQVFVFTPEGGIDKIPPGYLRQSAQSAAEIIPDHANDLLSLDAVRQYFELHLWKKKTTWDKHEVMACFKDSQHQEFDYAKAAKLFKLIPDDQVPVVMPWGQEGHRIISQLINAPHASRELHRRAQRYSVQIPRNRFDILVERGDIQQFDDRTAVLHTSWMYDEVLGFMPDKAEVLPPDESVI